MRAQSRNVLPQLSRGLEGLADMALDLRWSWSHAVDEVWQRLDPELWETTHNPWHILQTIALTRLEAFAADPEFVRLVQHHVEDRRRTLAAPSWFRTTYLERDSATDSVTSTANAIEVGVGAGEHTTVPDLIAYFSMEFGLSEALPIYSGGLGILAGDFLKVASDLGVPLVGIGLLWQQGYFRQALTTAGEQMEFYPFNDPGQLPIMPLRDREGEWLTVPLHLPRRVVQLRVWEVRAGRVKLFLLDSNDPVNIPADRGLTGELYGGAREIRLQQEMILGMGGWRVLRELGLHPDVCHLNEGHAALAILERARWFMLDHGVDLDVALAATRAGNLFTTHTPVEAGFDRFPPALVAEYLHHYAVELGIDVAQLLALGRLPAGNLTQEGLGATDIDEPFNMAYLAIRGSGAVNGVSRLHGGVSRSLFQHLFPRWPAAEVPVGHVTNGVHVPSWDSQEADALWTRHCGKERWLNGITDLGDKIRAIADEELWDFREDNRRRLILAAREHVSRQGPVAGSLENLGADASCLCDPSILTLGFARRFTSYKRVDLLLYDPQRLQRILCRPDSGVQLVLAGKAHPADTAGKAIIRRWTEFIRSCGERPHVLFLVDYDMGIAEHLVHGVDVWINTPRRPWEASGTSGMKVLVNGGLNLSELDGWWAEAYDPEVGWALGDGLKHDADPAWDAIEAERLYDLIENVIIPEFYDRDEKGIPRRWVARVRESMARLAPRYSSNRMMQEYLDSYYLPLTSAYRKRAGKDDGVDTASDIAAWRKLLADRWDEIAFTAYETATQPEEEGQRNQVYRLTVRLELRDLPPETIRVELYADPLQTTARTTTLGAEETSRTAENLPEIHVFTHRGAALGECGDLGGEAEVSAARRVHTYTLSLITARPLEDYTPRVVPWHRHAMVPLEASHILWYR